MRGPLLPCALVLAACWACDNPDPMMMQEKAKAYRESDFFSDHRAMRPLVPDTVPQERVRGPAALTTGREGGDFVERLPIPPTRALLERGRERFELYCAPCHGLMANGQGPVARYMAQRPPPPLIAPLGEPVSDTDAGFVPSRAREDGTGLRFPPGYYFMVMTEGYGLMGSYAEQLPVEDRWAVVGYLRALAMSQHMPLASAPPDVQQRLLQEAR